MDFSLYHTIQILERTPSVFRTWCSGLSDEWIFANEGPKTWSAFDILGHLIHGENTDWIPRAQIILSDSNQKKFEPFDRFAQEELSQGKSFDELLDEFEQLRKHNLIKLKSWELSDEQLARTGIHPEFGKVTLQQLLATWAVHDLSHINQLSRVMTKAYKEEVGPWKNYIRTLKD